MSNETSPTDQTPPQTDETPQEADRVPGDGVADVHSHPGGKPAGGVTPPTVPGGSDDGPAAGTHGHSSDVHSHPG